MNLPTSLKIYSMKSLKYVDVLLLGEVNVDLLGFNLHKATTSVFLTKWQPIISYPYNYANQNYLRLIYALLTISLRMPDPL